jgi:hypothetical protein
MLDELDIPVRRLSGSATENLLPTGEMFQNRLHREAAQKLDALIQQSGDGKSLKSTRGQLAIADDRSYP